MLWTMGLVVLVALFHDVIGPLVFTGDETRYVYASVAAWLGHGLSLSPAEWSSWLAAQGVSVNIEPGRGSHSFIHALLLSPVVAMAGIESGRWVQLLIVCAIAIPFLSAADTHHRASSAVWTGLYIVSIPVLAYLKLLYAESWLFLLLAIALYYCSRAELSTRGALIALMCLILLPFVHIRAALFAAIFGLFLFYRIWLRSGKVDATLIRMALLVCIALPVFAWYQILISGEVSGSASVAAIPSLDRLTKLFAMQIFGYRHGLAYYNPIALIGIAGLFIGVMRKDKFLTTCAIAFSAYVASIVWGTASESYAGRFWVAAIPILVYGSVYWFRTVGPRLRWAFVMPLALMTLYNSALFIFLPNAYLENRFGSVPYEFLQNFICKYFDFGLIAATDPFEAGKIVIHDDNDIAVACLLTGFIACLAGMGARQRKQALTFATVAAVIFSFAVLKSFINPIPSDRFAFERGIDRNGNAFLTVITQDREMLRGFKIGKYSDSPLWGLDDYSPREFVVTGYGPEDVPYPEQRISGYQLAKLEHRQRYSKITITATKPGVTKGWNQLPIMLF